MIFVRVTDSADKAESLKILCRESGESDNRFIRTADELGSVPGSPFAYWFSASLRGQFARHRPFMQSGMEARQGLATGNNERFCRAWWEVPPNTERWRPFSNGGRATAFYRRILLVVNWWDDGRELREFRDPRTGKQLSRTQNTAFYERPGLTWSLRAARFSPQALERRTIISVRGYGAFESQDEGQLCSNWGVMASSTFDALFKATLGRVGFPEFVIGKISLVPVPHVPETIARRLEELVSQGWILTRSLDTSTETSHAFLLPGLLQVAGESFGERVSRWSAARRAVLERIEDIRSEIDAIAFDLYGIDPSDRQKIAEGLGVLDNVALGEDPDGEYEVGECADEPDQRGLAMGLVSWAVGVAVGRYEIRLATGDCEWPPNPGPFDPLPQRSAAMISHDGEPRSGSLSHGEAHTAFLVDDPGHHLDLSTSVRRVLDRVFGGDADRWWTDLGVELRSKDRQLRTWLRDAFFEAHLTEYSAPSRVAPVYWPLGTRSGSYRVWLYAHQMTTDSLFRVLSDIVDPKLQVEERRLSDLRDEAGVSPSASQRKAIDAQERFVAELHEFGDELAAVAPLWAPDLNDGAVVVLAPLWRLFAHHRGWSNELKDRWRKLAAGDYDWAQLAMRLWPDRVIPKCAEDRSLAIAHGLEDVFWVADKDNPDKWHPRTILTIPVEELIAARTNPAITTARQHPTP